MAKAKVKKQRKKVKRVVVDGIVHVSTSFNNTIVTFTDLQGDTVCWSTCGAQNFRGSRKSTPHAAKVAAEVASSKAKEFGMRSVSVRICGAGAGRDSVVRELIAQDFKIVGITDVTPIPHNGCKAPKKRRV